MDQRSKSEAGPAGREPGRKSKVALLSSGELVFGIRIGTSPPRRKPMVALLSSRGEAVPGIKVSGIVLADSPVRSAAWTCHQASASAAVQVPKDTQAVRASARDRAVGNRSSGDLARQRSRIA